MMDWITNRDMELYKGLPCLLFDLDNKETHGLLKSPILASWGDPQDKVGFGRKQKNFKSTKS